MLLARHIITHWGSISGNLTMMFNIQNRPLDLQNVPTIWLAIAHGTKESSEKKNKIYLCEYIVSRYLVLWSFMVKICPPNRVQQMDDKNFKFLKWCDLEKDNGNSWSYVTTNYRENWSLSIYNNSKQSSLCNHKLVFRIDGWWCDNPAGLLASRQRVWLFGRID